MQKDFEKALVQLASRRQVLTETDISALKDIQKLEFATYYSLTIEYDCEKAKAKNKKKLTERSLRLAEKKLKIVKSKNLREIVKKAT